MACGCIISLNLVYIFSIYILFFAAATSYIYKREHILSEVVIKLVQYTPAKLGRCTGCAYHEPAPFKIRNRRCARKREREREGQEKGVMGTRKDDVAAGKADSIRLPK